MRLFSFLSSCLSGDRSHNVMRIHPAQPSPSAKCHAKPYQPLLSIPSVMSTQQSSSSHGASSFRAEPILWRQDNVEIARFLPHTTKLNFIQKSLPSPLSFFLSFYTRQNKTKHPSCIATTAGLKTKGVEGKHRAKIICVFYRFWWMPHSLARIFRPSLGGCDKNSQSRAPLF